MNKHTRIETPATYIGDLSISKWHPDESISCIPDETARRIAQAQLAYLRGDFSKAADCYRYTPAEHPLALSACTLGLVGAICENDYELYEEITEVVKCSMSCAQTQLETCLYEIPLVTTAVSMSVSSLVPDWIMTMDFQVFSRETIPYLLYLRAKNLQNTHQFAALLELSRTALLLIEKEESFSHLELYFHLFCGIAYLSLNQQQQARKQVLEAMELGLPCGFIVPFSELRIPLTGLVEACFEQAYPQHLAAFQSQWQHASNWIAFHNRFSKDHLACILTPREFQVAELLCQGFSYEEIGSRMHFSLGLVKKIISDLYGKLYIKSRKELIWFL